MTDEERPVPLEEQLRETQRLLEEARARYAGLYDSAPIAFCTLDSDCRIAELNLAGARVLGDERDKLIGRPLASSVPLRARHDLRCFLDRVLDSGAGDTVEMVVDEAPTRTIEITATPMFDARGDGVGCRVVLADISERKRAEDALREAVRMREHFLAVVSHELRNPLNAILMGIELLMHNQPVGERRRVGRRQLESIKRASDRMNRLIADLLDLSSMDAGHLSVQPADHDASDIVAAAFEVLAPVAAEKSIRLLIEPSAVRVHCDRERILQVLLNLVGNAIKFSNKDSEISVRAQQKGEMVEWSVRDSGAGMTREQVAHAFDPYWRAEKIAGKGTGLGLAIAKSIVDFHQGKIWVDSILGRGTTVSFTLPQGSAAPAPAPSSQPVDGVPSRAAPSSILVVDDEADTRDTLAEVLRRNGYEVSTAGNGAEALEVLRARGASLVLLDLVMPVMDGWEFLSSRDERTAQIPVVLISGQADASRTAESLHLAGYIQKPIGIAALLKVVREVTGLA